MLLEMAAMGASPMLFLLSSAHMSRTRCKSSATAITRPLVRIRAPIFECVTDYVPPSTKETLKEEKKEVLQDAKASLRLVCLLSSDSAARAN